LAPKLYEDISLIKNLKHGGRVKEDGSQAPVAYIYNPSYSRGRDQEDGGSKPAWENSLFARPYLEKKTHHTKGLVEWLKV
jgi:hypothetical protein